MTSTSRTTSLMASALAAIGVALAPSTAAAQDYVIGMTAALTGPPSSTYAPAVAALRAYLDRINKAGGIGGKQVKLVIEDDAAQPSKAAANVKKLLSQDKAVLLMNASLSSTYAPVISEAKRANVPLLFAASVCPKQVFPPADPLLFCTTSFGASYDSRATLAFIKEQSGGKAKIGFSAMAIPVSRGEIEFAAKLAGQMGMTAAEQAIIPPPTADYTPFATKINGSGATWVYSWAPWVTQIRTFEALRRLGWKGDYISYAHLEAEGELARVKDPKFNVIGANALFQDDLPIHKEIRAAAKAAGITYPADKLAEGWIVGMVIEAVLKKAGAAEAGRIQAAMQDIKVDMKGLRGGPLEWTKDNHFRKTQSYRVYRWDTAKSQVVRVKDWMSFDVK